MTLAERQLISTPKEKPWGSGCYEAVSLYCKGGRSVRLYISAQMKHKRIEPTAVPEFVNVLLGFIAAHICKVAERTKFQNEGVVG